MAISTTTTHSPSNPSKAQKKQQIEKQKNQEPDSVSSYPPPLPCSSSPSNTYSCHQCRQRTANLVVFCKDKRSSKPCTIKICYKCLLNRYGEKAEEVALLDDWKCPKCRDICNCSLCMKKKGHKPTGILVHTAKATGFSSVSEMLISKGPKHFVSEEVVKDVDTSTEIQTASSKEKKVVSPIKSGNENRVDGNSDLNVQMNLSTSNGDVKKTVKKKRKILGENNTSCNVVKGGKGEGVELEKGTANPLNKDEEINTIDDDFVSDVKSPKKSRTSKEIIPNPIKEEKKMSTKDDVGLLEMTTEKQEKVNEREDSLPASNEMKVSEKKEEKIDEGKDSLLASNENKAPIASDATKVPEKESIVNAQAKLTKNTAICITKKNAMGIPTLNCDIDISLPQGINLTSVGGIDLPAEDVGHALQFLEFCNAFGKVLGLTKGQPESFLRELTRGSSRRRRQYSPVAQFQIQLLSLIQEDLGEESPLSQTSSGNSWLQALEKCISESHCKFEELPLNCFDKSGIGYELLDPSKKLRLLNFLCDEALSTVDLRNWIDEQHSKLIERGREAKQKVAAAKDKEKCLKQQIQDEMAKAIPEQHDLTSTLKVEAAKAHTEVLQAIQKLPKKKQRVDAVGTEPILLEGNGHILWRLRGYSCDPDILLQDIGSWDSVTPEDKWFTYDFEQKQVVEDCISSLRRKRVRAHVVPNNHSFEPSEENIKQESADDQSSPVSAKEDSQGNAEETRPPLCSQSNSSE